MIIQIDTVKELVHYNGKILMIRLADAFAMAPVGASLEILDRKNEIVSIKISISPD